MRRGTVIVFSKAPRAGAVKTRLAAEIGAGRATALFRVMLDRTITEAQKGPWRLQLAVDPFGGFERVWPTGVKRIAQGPGDLGARMARVFKDAPAGPVLIIGADAPGLRAHHLRAAFNHLRGADAVFGPAQDGGYWLVGLARRPAALDLFYPDLFRNVRWSSEHALSDTLRSLPATFDVQILSDTLADIDEAKDLSALGPFSTRSS
ncbi:MAG: TIGR04282 family arsenosugar biosynthesis glycosyltransferase [Pseudomonadota bacterium]